MTKKVVVNTEIVDVIDNDSPAFMQDTPPTEKNNLIKWALMHGMSEKTLEREGHNTTTIRIMALELEKGGYRRRPENSALRQYTVIVVEPANKEDDALPVFLRDTAPFDKNNLIKWALMHGMSEEKLEEEGHNVTTVRLMALELERGGYRQRQVKSKPARRNANVNAR